MTNWHASKSTERTLPRIVAYKTSDCWVFPSHSPIWYGHKVRHRTMTSNLHLVINYNIYIWCIYASRMYIRCCVRRRERAKTMPSDRAGTPANLSSSYETYTKTKLLVVCRTFGFFVECGFMVVVDELKWIAALLKWYISVPTPRRCLNTKPNGPLFLGFWASVYSESIYMVCDSIGNGCCLHRLPCSCCKLN